MTYSIFSPLLTLIQDGLLEGWGAQGTSANGHCKKMIRKTKIVQKPTAAGEGN